MLWWRQDRAPIRIPQSSRIATAFFPRPVISPGSNTRCNEFGDVRRKEVRIDKSGGPVRLHRALLRPSAKALDTGLSQPCRVRGMSYARAFPAKSESLCWRAFGTRSRVSATVDVVHRPSRNPKDLGQMHPAHRSSPLLRRGKRRPATLVGRSCRRQTDWVSRWRAPAASDGLGRTSGTTRAVLLADRLAIGETE